MPSSLNDPKNQMCYQKCDEPVIIPECEMDVVQAYTICDAVFDESRSPFAVSIQMFPFNMFLSLNNHALKFVA